MKTQKKALIVGVTGQDGSLLANLLTSSGFQVSGTYRRSASNNLWRLEELELIDRVNLYEYTIGDSQFGLRDIVKNNFDYIFYLAGDSYTLDSFKHPLLTININVGGCLEVLNSVELYSPETKVFLASSSEIFGTQTRNLIVNENSVRIPCNPYGVAQSSILDLANVYRIKSNLDISVGILFNHESPFRSPQFLTRKIVSGLIKILRGQQSYIELGNLDSARDWGNAKEFVKVFKEILENASNQNYVIATGQSVKVRDIFSISAKYLGFEPIFDGEGENEVCYDSKNGTLLMKSSAKYFRKIDTPALIGDSGKLMGSIGWKPKSDVVKLMSEMCEYERTSR